MRITAKFLDAKLARVNIARGYGREPEYSTIGALYLYHDITGYAVHQWCNDKGGVHRYHTAMTARECDAFLSGLLCATEV